MSDVNPYAAPLTGEVIAEAVQTDGGVWREAKTLVMWKDAVLPDRCVRCNAPANGRRLRRTLYWHHPLIWLIVLISPLIYIIVALIVRQKAVVAIGMCDRHYARRLKSILAWWLITAVCVGIFWYGIESNAGWFILAAVIAFLLNLCFAVAISTPVAPTRIDDHYVWLKKIHPDYLAQFPWMPQ
ncbi:MAG TPA: hypothetical protein VG125_05680 [Pirellulales bacterium]|jgi:hypothetical protein|nr:hypothetical protein [Pirellulales bacterium]